MKTFVTVIVGVSFEYYLSLSFEMFWILLYMILRAFPFSFMNIRKIDSLQKLRRVISMMFYLSIIACHISDNEHFDMNDISQIYKDYNMVLHMI